jgi:very-short-patch-repair endonuclease
MSLRSLQRLGERQHGVVTWCQLHAHVTLQVGRTARTRGWIEPVRPNVYRLAGSARTWQQAVMAVVLAAGDAAVASHATAAALWRFEGFRPGSVGLEVTVPRGRRPRLDNATVHATSRLRTGDRRRSDRIPVTAAARTACDLGARLPEPRLARLVDDALVRKLVTIEQLRETYETLRGGRRSIRAIGRILAARGDEAVWADSVPEARLVRWLREAGLPEPEQQHRIDAYRVDLAYPSRGLLVEYDGFAAHSTRSAFDADRRRQNALVLHDGLVVLRFTSASTREEVVRDVALAMARAAA